MIDFENQIFTLIATSLREKYGQGIYITGEPVSTVQKVFPAVSIIERSNTIYQRTRSTDIIENHATLMYEIDVYSNLTKGKKQQAKEITAIINDILIKHNFTRTFCEPLENLSNNKIYRIKSRFNAVIDIDGTFYTN